MDFFNKIILQGLFSLRSVGDVHVKNVVFGGHTFVFYFKIMHITFLESKVEMLQSLSPPVHWRVQDTDFLIRCICVNSSLTQPHQWEKTVLCQGEKL